MLLYILYLNCAVKVLVFHQSAYIWHAISSVCMSVYTYLNIRLILLYSGCSLFFMMLLHIFPILIYFIYIILQCFEKHIDTVGWIDKYYQNYLSPQNQKNQIKSHDHRSVVQMLIGQSNIFVWQEQSQMGRNEQFIWTQKKSAELDHCNNNKYKCGSFLYKRTT